ncbi:4765_t:CDS:2 [Acaulospora morrowiae]|uniref:rRNA adenine N(6)-methyltransferase n=1 Tax=Acaulospora morrowiae TaxID=94023 RepID=A0A9N8WBQ9_9GLOM|nr:4765_t:CDS:2 [Acaulospora morrowiae]
MTLKNLPKLLSTRDLIKIYNLTAKSQLSQNFILDKNITGEILRLREGGWIAVYHKIVKTSQICSDDALVVEVGPGPGLLTRSILETGVSNMVIVEKDKRFLPILTQLSEVSKGVLKVLHGDILNVDHSLILQAANITEIPVEGAEGDRLNCRVHLIGNLPFNIASPLLVQWMKMLYNREGIFRFPSVSMTLMFQKEVGDVGINIEYSTELFLVLIRFKKFKRIVADVEDSRRGRNSVLVQSLCEAKKVYQLPSRVFVPEPKVDAVLIQLKSLPNPVLTVPVNEYEEVVRYFYGKRRKTIHSALIKLKSKISPEKFESLTDGIEKLEIDLSLRPEKLTSEQFCRLTKIFIENSIKI